MNALLLGIFRILNGLLGLVIIVFFTFLGATQYKVYAPILHDGFGLTVDVVQGTLLGLTFGILISASICGPLAVFLEIPHKLGEIRDALDRLTESHSRMKLGQTNSPASTDDARWRP